MRVSIEDNSIPNSALLDGVVSGTSSSGGGSTIDSSIITLVASVDILGAYLVGIVDGQAVLASYDGIPCIGIATKNVSAGENIDIKISGLSTMINDMETEELYLGANGEVRTYSYVPNKLLQKVADKINDNQIFINIGKSVLML